MKLRLSHLALLSICLNIAFSTNARILEYETTRQKATGGAGAGALLVEESVFLNPASIAFFNVSSFYFQKVNTEQTSDSSEVSNSDTMSIIASETKGDMKGAIAYTKQKKGSEKRKTIGASMASPLSKTSAFGMSYQHIKETLKNDQNVDQEETYKKFTIGLIRNVSPELTIGFVVIDPLRERPQDSKAIVGFQYEFKNTISLIFDSGADWKEDLSSSLVWKAAASIKFLDNFFLRVGTYRDKALKERGSGGGIGWVQPKLTFEVALKNSTLEESKILNQEGEQIKETSLSMSYRF
ncbi:hypothetical protein A9Q84_20585 [Halobacteriovorax marinus]|uniref:Secreted protein n=1 Tax=Halobacteriovorax marinus TaxID=97084 RepID=A0A1Y5F6P5_9BACT|nr:hypothetical protein A9Q84_20585 [Halobacteriovorax marinus]